jgi:hypothetical protein
MSNIDDLHAELAIKEAKIVELIQREETALRKASIATAELKVLNVCLNDADEKLTMLRSNANRIQERSVAVAELNSQLLIQRDIMAHLLQGGEITQSVKKDIISSGLGEAVIIDQKHAVALISKELNQWKKAYVAKVDWLPVATKLYYTLMIASLKLSEEQRKLLQPLIDEAVQEFVALQLE